MSGLSQVKTSLVRLQGERERIRKDRDAALAKSVEAAKEAEAGEKARVVVQLVAQQTQEKLQYKIAELGSLALAAIFPRPYRLDVQFTPRRGKTECDVMFEREGQLYSPMEDSGGGAVDVAACFLRPSIWTMIRPKRRPLFLLDEPFSGLKGSEANEQALRMLCEVCDRLRVQIIMVADERVDRGTLADNCDRLLEVVNKDGKSEIKTL